MLVLTSVGVLRHSSRDDERRCAGFWGGDDCGAGYRERVAKSFESYCLARP